VPIYLELPFYSVCKISSMFDGNTWSKIIFKIQNFLYLLKKCEQQTHSLWTREQAKHTSTSASRTFTFRKRNMAKHYGEDLRFKARCSHNTKIQKKKQKNKKLAKLKTWKVDLGNRVRPVGLKIWKGGPGKKKQNNKKKQSYGCWNTLMEEYTAPVQKWRLLPRFLGQEWTFSPVKAPITTLHWAYHIRWLDQALKNVISNKDCRVPYCETAPLSNLTCFVSFHRVTYPIRLYDHSSQIHTFMHSCIHIDTFMYSHIHACTCICTTSIYTWLHQSPRFCPDNDPSAQSSIISAFFLWGEVARSMISS